MPAVPPETQSADGAFPPTRWSLVARIRSGGQDSSAALNEICHRYWYPIYAYLRRQGHSPHDAEDLTQSFFLRVFSQEMLLAPEPEKGRLRSFLLGALRRFLVDHHRVQQAAKRGSGRATIPIEWDDAEHRYSVEPPDERDPEQLYYRVWATELLAGVKRRLTETLAASDRAEYFRALDLYITNDETAPPYAELARQFNTTESALRITVFRLRRKFRDLLEGEIARTMAEGGDVAGELAWLRAILSA